MVIDCIKWCQKEINCIFSSEGGKFYFYSLFCFIMNKYISKMADGSASWLCPQSGFA